MKGAPCKNCPDRHRACWDKCEMYQAFLTAHRAAQEALRREKKADDDWHGVLKKRK